MGPWVVLAAACAVAAGAFGARCYVDRCVARNRATRLKEAAAPEAPTARGCCCDGLAAVVLEHCRKAAAGYGRVAVPQPEGWRGRLAERQRRLLRVAGMGDVEVAAWSGAAGRLAAQGAVAGAVAGCGFSPGMAAFCAVVAGVGGLLAPWWAAGKEAAARGEQLGEQLPEMLEVVALGLRSGLSFERSFALYPAYFDTMLARECQVAMGRWETGLMTRDEALMGLADGYDSPLLRRTLQGVKQALRLGTALAENLEQAAEEARKQQRARKEEVVARAPIKMMAPIGVLILPAMLLLVLGPVLLELMAGF